VDVAGADTTVGRLHAYSVEGPEYLLWAMRIHREETAARKEVHELEYAGLQDMLFSIAVMLGDIRRARTMEHPKNVWAMDLQALTKMEADRQSRHQRDVWFPPMVPRGVPSPPRPIQSIIPRSPHPAITQLLDEEWELREWVVRLEVKLRDPIERGCVDSWLLITGPQRTILEEYENRREMLAEEIHAWKQIQNRHKHLLPAAFFTDIARAQKEAKMREILANPVTAEAFLRQSLEAEEVQQKRLLFQWLHEKYGVRLYSTSRVEVSYRCEIEAEAEESSATTLALQFCEETFRHSRLAFVCLHAATPAKPFLVDFFSKCGGIVLSRNDSSQTSAVANPIRCADQI
jgi:hypothetical protein